MCCFSYTDLYLFMCYTGKDSIMYQQPQYPNHPPFAPAPQKKPRRWPWIVALVVVFFVGYGAGHTPDTTGKTDTTTTQSQPTTANSTPTATPTATPKPKPKVWTTTHTFTGNGSKKTATFAVPGDWKLQWKCDPASFDNIDYNVIVDVDNSDGSSMDENAISTQCKSNNKSGETEEHQSSGNVYLAIVSEGDWTFTVQELK